jgi:hypothetical protein
MWSLLPKLASGHVWISHHLRGCFFAFGISFVIIILGILGRKNMNRAFAKGALLSWCRLLEGCITSGFVPVFDAYDAHTGVLMPSKVM